MAEKRQRLDESDARVFATAASGSQLELRLRLHHHAEALQSERVTCAVLFSEWVHSFTFLKRSAFEMTDTELRLIAAPASMGLSSRPKKG